MRGGLAFDGGVGGEDDFGDGVGVCAGDEGFDVELGGAAVVEGGECAAEHVVLAFIKVAALDGPEIGEFFHHADDGRVTAGVCADMAGVGSVEIAADGASADGGE